MFKTVKVELLLYQRVLIGFISIEEKTGSRSYMIIYITVKGVLDILKHQFFSKLER